MKAFLTTITNSSRNYFVFQLYHNEIEVQPINEGYKYSWQFVVTKTSQQFIITSWKSKCAMRYCQCKSFINVYLNRKPKHENKRLQMCHPLKIEDVRRRSVVFMWLFIFKWFRIYYNWSMVGGTNFLASFVTSIKTFEFL